MVVAGAGAGGSTGEGGCSRAGAETGSSKWMIILISGFWCAPSKQVCDNKQTMQGWHNLLPCGKYLVWLFLFWQGSQKWMTINLFKDNTSLKR